MKKLYFYGFMYLCLSLMTSFTFAQEVEPPKGEKEKVALASKLAVYGESQRDALVLANAASLFLNLSGDVSKADKDGMEGAKFDPIDLLAKARQIAQENGDQELVAVINKIEQTKSAKRSWLVPRCFWRYTWVGWYWEYVWWCG